MNPVVMTIIKLQKKKMTEKNAFLLWPIMFSSLSSANLIIWYKFVCQLVQFGEVSKFCQVKIDLRKLNLILFLSTNVCSVDVTLRRLLHFFFNISLFFLLKKKKKNPERLKGLFRVYVSHTGYSKDVCISISFSFRHFLICVQVWRKSKYA